MNEASCAVDQTHPFNLMNQKTGEKKTNKKNIGYIGFVWLSVVIVVSGFLYPLSQEILTKLYLIKTLSDKFISKAIEFHS